MQIVFYVILFIVGACLGSFLCCQARRLHYNTTHKSKLRSSRSICLHCHKQLKWYDNLPIISWLALRGKCRFCRHSIGWAELLSELGLAIAFLLLGTCFDINTTSPLSWILFILTLVYTTIITFLAIYDGLYGELPTVFLIIAIIIACIILALNTTITLSTTPFSTNLIWQPVASVALLGGLYLLLYLISKGKWVGDGDWLLCVSIAIVLGHPWLALFVLFLSNFLACLVMLPTLKGNTRRRIHFGPFLVIAFVIVLSVANNLQSML